MPNILVAGKLHSAGRALLDAAPGMAVRYIEDISEASYAPQIGWADALLIRTQPLSAATVAKAKSCASSRAMAWAMTRWMSPR